MTTTDFCHEIAMSVARQFLDGAVDFVTTDTVASNYYGLMIDDICVDRLDAFPEPAYSVFLAFDAGEYHHPGDAEDQDPVELYTKPELRRIVAEQVSDRLPL